VNEESLKKEDDAYREYESLEKKVEKFGKRKKETMGRVQYVLERQVEYRKTGRKKIIDAAYEAERCGSWLTFRYFYTAGKTKLQGGMFCHKPMLCGVCAIIRTARMLRAYAKKFKQVLKDNPNLKVFFITTTVKNGEDLLERFEHLRSNKRIMVNRRRKAKNNQRAIKTMFMEIEGAVWSYEMTNIGNGWHPHDHMATLVNKKIDVNKFREKYRSEWNKLTGDSYQINVQEITNEDDMLKALIETFKYSIKMNDMGVEKQIEAFEKLSRKRMVESCGILRGVKIDSALDDEIEDEDLLPYVDLVYRYAKDRGYEFIKSMDQNETKESLKKYDEEMKRQKEVVLENEAKRAKEKGIKVMRYKLIVDNERN
jgi:hypothetical protein